MKTYTFHSTLPPDRVHWRLTRYQKGKADPLRDGVSSVEVLSPTQFCIVYIGFAGLVPSARMYPSTKARASAHTAFYGTIEPEGEGSRITGHFAAPRSDKRTFIITAVVLYGIGVAASGGMLLDPRLLAVFAVLFLLFYLTDNLILNQGQKKQIIHFIEKHLLRP